ncbi:methylated-DNA--[protein]-cysteine S-methyltransferase [Uliginosibacterium sp. 31-16]|uniref:methylated-DNA--[protein]-cysteine S-methyltransferase n=1 Tax=Uliginosibacterium sp. 31-16 TaxID=3068315 RepID=UPI00273EBA71|nr:methylated-DNA--[protein]-cysteine S-methyltransferase [Uliginosibacterium sp. 31-16]MDP5238079.1 methylated-DNA--[protein]-cysteine S-methyltransferase [Uliginosibacterium sp. 31-16]
MSHVRVLASLPTCHLGMRQNAAGLIEEILFLPLDATPEIASDALAKSFIAQIEQYLTSPQHTLSLPLAPCGTAFQQRVWHAIRSIPAGCTRNYGELAEILVSAPRAVGQACGANPFPLITPCHRVLAKTGLGGFAHAQNGWLLDTKRWLLQHEGAL